MHFHSFVKGGGSGSDLCDPPPGPDAGLIHKTLSDYYLGSRPSRPEPKRHKSDDLEVAGSFNCGISSPVQYLSKGISHRVYQELYLLLSTF